MILKMEIFEIENLNKNKIMMNLISLFKLIKLFI